MLNGLRFLPSCRNNTSVVIPARGNGWPKPLDSSLRRNDGGGWIPACVYCLAWFYRLFLQYSIWSVLHEEERICPDITLHKNAPTTPAMRRELQGRRACVYVAIDRATRYGYVEGRYDLKRLTARGFIEGF